MNTLTKIVVPIALLMASCSSNVYKDKAFFSKNNVNGQSLAILPVEVSFSGNLPKNWDADRIAREEKDRSLSFQEEIYEDLLFQASNKPKSKKVRIALMDTRVVNERLASNGFELKDTWKVSSKDLAGILGVDMVIRARVENVRYMSQAAATGINVGASVLEGILNKGDSNNTVIVPRARSGESDMDISLYHSSRENAIARIDHCTRLNTNRLPVYVMN